MIERDLLMSILKLTVGGSVKREFINKDAKIPAATVNILLEKLQNEGLVYLEGDEVNVGSDLRLKLAIKAIALGADVENTSRFLRWQEFEEIAAVALERNGFSASKNVRFKQSDRRWEIDVVGCKNPLVICIDCKHWQHGISASALTRIVDAQVERTRALSESLPNLNLKIEFAKWDRAKFVPTILALIPGSFKFYDEVPVVSILQLQDFLIQLPAFARSLKFFQKDFDHLRHDS